MTTAFSYDRIEINAQSRKEPNKMIQINNLGYCGVDCAVCADFTQGQCPSCRITRWTEDDLCHPVRCCREKGIEICGQCDGFPCGLMAEFYEESHSHRQAGNRMSQWKDKSN